MVKQLEGEEGRAGREGGKEKNLLSRNSKVKHTEKEDIGRFRKKRRIVEQLQKEVKAGRAGGRQCW